jgi:hypothetical protein
MYFFRAAGMASKHQGLVHPDATRPSPSRRHVEISIHNDGLE